MALGKRKEEHQEAWIASTDLPQAPGHPFYIRLNQLLAEAKFDEWIEELCRTYYAPKKGRPSLPPGIYFRMVLVGYFEGISSQRGIAWRCSDSRSLASFLGYGPTESPPDHSTMSRTHGRLPLEVHEKTMAFVLEIARREGLLQGKQVAVDSTFLEANAAMKSIALKETGENYKDYVKRLAEEAGLENPSEAELRRFDKARKDKKVSNDDWESKTDRDARIAKMKDGRTHLAYKAEHVVDLESGLVVAAVATHANHSDAETLCDSVMTAQSNLEAAGSETRIEEVVADKGYHKASTLELVSGLGIRTYIPEPDRPHPSRWTDKPPENRQAVYNNRRRVGRAKSKRLQRRRSEVVERTFAHVCETGGARRCWLRGLAKVAKRYLLQATAHNLAVIMRQLFGFGTPKSLQGLRGLSPLLYFDIRVLVRFAILLQRRLNRLTPLTAIRQPRPASFRQLFGNA